MCVTSTHRPNPYIVWPIKLSVHNTRDVNIVFIDSQRPKSKSTKRERWNKEFRA